MSKESLAIAMNAVQKRNKEINTFHFDEVQKPFKIDLRMKIEEMVKILNTYFAGENAVKLTERNLKKKLKELNKL